MAKKLEQIIENVSSEIILVEKNDLQALAEIHSAFETIQQILKSKDLPDLLNITEETLQLLAEIMLQESKDPDKDLSQIRKNVSAIQCSLRDGLNSDDTKTASKSSLKSSKGKETKTKTQKNAQSKKTLKDLEDLSFDEKILMSFTEKQETVLQDIEELALTLEKGYNQNKFEELLRIIHTIKGEAGVLELKDLEEVAHNLESLLNEKTAETNFEVIFQFKDWLGRELKNIRNGNKNLDKEQILNEIKSEPSVKKPALPEIKEAEYSEESSEIKFSEDPSFIMDFVTEAAEHLQTCETILLEGETGTIPEESLNTVFRGFHTIKGLSGFLNLTDIQALTHEAETVLDLVRKNQLKLNPSIVDVLIEVLDKVKQLVEAVEKASKNATPLMHDREMPALIKKLQMIQRGEYVEASPQKIEDTSKKEIESAEETTQAQVKSTKIHEDYIRIGTEKLDHLVNLVGELVIAQSMLTQELSDQQSQTLLKNLEQSRKIARELQELSMTLRMVPLKNTFLKMSRIVRDVAKKMGKKVDFRLIGEDTELDKTVVDKIGDPLIHMVRNSVDHGLEASEDERIKAGKTREGRVTLRAFHKGGNIYIEIEDDGRGLDKAAIVKKAKERNLITSEDNLSDRDIYHLIFEPGFSTAKKVTDVSGRGVGMDVVRKTIESLRGQAEISSTLGSGTNVSLRLPLTLAIIEGMVIRSAGEKYIIPTLSVVTSMKPKKTEISSVIGKGEMLNWHGKLIPLFSLEQIFFEVRSEKPSYEQLVIILEEEGTQVGFLIDELLGQQEVVIKSLGSQMKGIAGLSGGAIMPDGTVGLILDIGGLVKITNEMQP